MALTIGIVIGGITKGIERWSRILMPTLFCLLILLLVRVMFLDGFGDAMAFLFSPDFSKLTGSAVLEAVGHSFFTLSLGMGAMITYGSYLSVKDNVIKTAWAVGLLDTLIALLAGVVIFSVVFSFGQEPGAGPKLMFVTLPVLFKQMTGGALISVAFFLLVAFAALTSAISLLEVVVTYWDEVHKWSRKRTALAVGGTIWALGILCALSFNVMADVTIFGKNAFDLFDFTTSKITLPVGGLLIAVFYGWVLGPRAVAATFGDKPATALFCQGLMWSARIVAPVAVAIMLVMGLS